jgi:alkylation response protein AidB-like acyl-CoA dehydrogenase
MKGITGRLAQAADGLEQDTRLLAESAARVLGDVCNSRNLHVFADGDSDLDTRLGALAAELGWYLVGVPEELGGLGLGIPGIAALSRELGSRAAPGGVIETTCALAWLAALDDADAIVARLIDAVGEGRCAIAVPAFSGPGDEPSITMLAPANAAFAVVPFSTGSAPAWAVVDLADPKILREPQATWDRTRAIATLVLEGVTPLHVIPDPDGQAGALLEALLALAVSADSLGGARAALDLAVAYTSERIQFGRPVGTYQALKHRAATAEVQIGSAEDLLGYAVESLSSGQPGVLAWVSVVKAQACEAYRLAAEECVLFHGGVGFTAEFDCHLYLKRANLNVQIAGDERANRDKAAELFIAASRGGISLAEIA